jgi:hypothetical protein
MVRRCGATSQPGLEGVRELRGRKPTCGRRLRRRRHDARTPSPTESPPTAWNSRTHSGSFDAHQALVIEHQAGKKHFRIQARSLCLSVCHAHLFSSCAGLRPGDPADAIGGLSQHVVRAPPRHDGSRHQAAGTAAPRYPQFWPTCRRPLNDFAFLRVNSAVRAIRDTILGMIDYFRPLVLPYFTTLPSINER